MNVKRGRRIKRGKGIKNEEEKRTKNLDCDDSFHGINDAGAPFKRDRAG